MEPSWNKVRELRSQEAVYDTEKNYSEAWRVRKEANQMERELLNRDIMFLMKQYQEALEYGNKSDLICLGRVLRKKQIRRESLEVC